MGRYMPLECEHGRVIDWGDFGGDSEPAPCPDCERLRLEAVAERARFDAAVRDVVDFLSEPCWFDHNGDCQAHGGQQKDECFYPPLRAYAEAHPAPTTARIPKDTQ